MRIPKPPSRHNSRWSTSSFDWEIVNNPVETGIYTQSRPPQRIDSNKPHKQAATASANGGPSHGYLDLSEGGIDNSTIYYPSPAPSFITTTAAVAHVPPSNPESSSTDTAHTDDTFPAQYPTHDHHHHPTQPTPTFTTYPAPLPTYPQLNEANMHAHQQLLNEYQYAHQGAVTAWADGAGMGTRLVGVPQAGVPYFYTVNALVAAGRAGRAGGGAVGDDWCVVPQPTGADGDLAGAGTWTGDGVGAEGVGAVVRLFDGFGV